MKKLLSVVLFLVAAGLTGCTSVSPGYVGVEISKAGANRGVQDVTMKTGWVFYNPAWTSVIEYPTFMQTAKWTKSANEGNQSDESITFTTKDSSTVNADISVSYQLAYDKVPSFYIQFRADDIQDFTNGFMRNVTRDAFNEAAGNYTVEQVMGDNAPLLKDVRALVQVQLGKYGIQVEQLGFIGAPRPPDSVNQAINLKVQAQQIALQKQIEVTQAEADARKNEAWADGDAKANVIRAQADATANKLRSESLSPALVEWTAIMKWDGKRPTVEGNSGGLLINIPQR
jgi:regulator of protease activity HflC (stomatin/prohibitin superfamily)